MFFFLLNLLASPVSAKPFKCDICDMHTQTIELLSEYKIEYAPTTNVNINARHANGLSDEHAITFLIQTYADVSTELPNEYFQLTVKNYEPQKQLTCDFSQNFLFVLNKEQYNEVISSLNIKTEKPYFGFYENVLGHTSSSLGFLCYDCQNGLIYDHLDFIVANTCY